METNQPLESSSDPRPLNPQGILVRGVNWLGDAVMTTPALQRLRERFPQAKLALVTPAKLADLWQGEPLVDRVIPIPAGAKPWAVGRLIRQASAQNGGFDLALVLPNSPRSALEVWLGRVPRRVGYARTWRNWLLTDRVPERPGHVRMPRLTARQVHELVGSAPLRPHPLANLGPAAHQVHDYLYLAAAVGADPAPLAPRLAVTPSELAGAVQLLGSPGSVWIGVNPSAAYGPAKRWPADRFAAVMRAVGQQIPTAGWVLVGAAGDRALCEQIIRSAGTGVNLAGRTSLRQLAAVLKSCRLVLTTDSGPMHLAAAVGTPVAALFGSTSPALTGPGGPGDSCHRLLRAVAPCAPCFRRECPIDLRCLTGISPDTVAAAVLSILAAPTPAVQ